MISSELYELRCKELIDLLREWGEHNEIDSEHLFTLPCAAVSYWLIAASHEEEDSETREGIWMACLEIVSCFRETLDILSHDNNRSNLS